MNQAEPISPPPITPQLSQKPEYIAFDDSEDVWDPRTLGFDINNPSVANIISFRNFKQVWLKNLTKRFVRFDASTKTLGTVQKRVGALRRFSQYLDEHHKFCGSVNYIDRELILSFLDSLRAAGLKPTSIGAILSHLKSFFDTGALNSWFECDRYLILPQDFPKSSKSLPRFIPPDVLAQLNELLDRLPKPVMRMVLILQECGLRLGELFSLTLNCIHQDHKGDWFLGFYREKVKAEHRIPISKELVAVIQEQQKFIQEQFPNYGFLCCSSMGMGRKYVPKAMKPSSNYLSRYLNELAKTWNITDQSGQVWHFQTHQFRHTLGTKMINNGVPIHIIQQYLGHGSPEMTITYARIHDQTLKDEFLLYYSKVVTVSGEVIQETSTIQEGEELAWMRKNVLAQSLPNGSCARPLVKGPCPHANACLTCGDFRTTAEFLEQHETQLQNTELIIARAKANGWQRQVEMNEAVASNLTNIITSLTQEVENVGA